MAYNWLMMTSSCDDNWPSGSLGLLTDKTTKTRKIADLDRAFKFFSVSVLALQSRRTAHSEGVLDDYLITVDTTSLDQHKLFYLHHRSSESENCLVSVFHG